jgi:hypothetical protein
MCSENVHLACEVTVAVEFTELFHSNPQLINAEHILAVAIAINKL